MWSGVLLRVVNGFLGGDGGRWGSVWGGGGVVVVIGAVVGSG